jgi:hypothetical protein
MISDVVRAAIAVAQAEIDRLTDLRHFETALVADAVRKHGAEPWRAFLSPEMTDLIAALAADGCPLTHREALQLADHPPAWTRHDLAAGCGGEQVQPEQAPGAGP